MTVLSTASGAALLAHGLHYAMVLLGLWGLAALLLPHALDRFSPTAPRPGPRDAHDLRVAALREAVATGTLGTPGGIAPGTTAGLDAAPSAPRADRGATLVLPLVLVGTATAAGIHAAVAPPHLRDSLLQGAFFLVVALAQAGIAAGLLLRPTVEQLRLAVVLDVAVLLVWLVSRLVGLPFGILPEAHPLGGWDVVCSGWELLVVVGSVHLLTHGVPRRLPGWFSWHTAARASVGVAAVSLTLLTLVGAHS